MKGFLSACDRAVGLSDEKGWKPLVYLISTCMCVCTYKARLYRYERHAVIIP